MYFDGYVARPKTFVSCACFLVCSLGKVYAALVRVEGSTRERPLTMKPTELHLLFFNFSDPSHQEPTFQTVCNAVAESNKDTGTLITVENVQPKKSSRSGKKSAAGQQKRLNVRYFPACAISYQSTNSAGMNLRHGPKINNILDTVYKKPRSLLGFRFQRIAALGSAYLFQYQIYPFRNI